jgi:hypothetical protein
MSCFHRRDFVKLAAAGTAALGVLGVRRKSGRAQEPTRAARVLLVNADGGMRSTVAYNASTKRSLNPWNVEATLGALSLGKVMVSRLAAMPTASSWPGVAAIPGILDVAAQFSLVAGVDHVPGGFRAADHTDDLARMATGYYGVPGTPALLTVINRYMAAQAGAPVVSLPPPYGGASIQTDPYAGGDWLAHVPTALDPAQMPDPPASAAGPGRSLEDALDANLRARRSGREGTRVDGFIALKHSIRRFGPLFASAPFDLADPANLDAEFDGVTNRMLLEAVGFRGNYVAPSSAGVNQPFFDGSGLSAALALRLLQAGSPAVFFNAGNETYDSHSAEDLYAPDLYTHHARIMAGIHFALSHMVDADGEPLLAGTLVVSTSEFGRTAYDSPTGWNDGGGSDHDGTFVDTRNQAHLVFGAGVPAGRVLGPTDDDNVPESGMPISTQALLATICSALGLERSLIDALWPPGTPFYPEGAPLLDLWA